MSNRLSFNAKNTHFMKFFKNSSWMLSEYLVKIISAVLVVIYVARYLGPDSFGLLTYALAIVSIFMTISRLGMESILVREVASNAQNSKALVGTAWGLMLISSIISIIFISIIVWTFEESYQIKVSIWILSLGLIFQTFLVIDYNFQAHVKAKYSALAKSSALLLGSLIKIYLVFLEVDLIYFVIAFMFDHLLIAIFLFVMHRWKAKFNFLFLFDVSLIRPLLKSAWPMVLSALAIMLYMRVDQIMIKNILDVHQLGLYAAATRIYDGWIMIPFAISMSLIPVIVHLKTKSINIYEKRLSQLFAFLFWLGVVAALITHILGEWLMHVTFGNEYKDATGVLKIVMWSAALTALGSASARYLTVENMERKIALRTGVGLVINIVLNFFLIPIYGIEGAAFATLITLLIINYFINFLDCELKQLLRICNNALLLKFVFENRIQ